MSLSRKIAAGAADLARPDAPPQTVSAEDGPFRLDLPVSLATAVGVECQGLTFSASHHPERSLDDLKAWGRRLASRLTYLMEPLAVHEADPVGVEVILRSQSPTPRNGKRSFFEARLARPGVLKFDRIAYDEATRQRRVVPCQFTNEVLERLVDDLVATA